MTKIKICGITRMEDVEIINQYKPDYVGLVFAESKRKVGLAQAIELFGRMDAAIKKVGVFANNSLEEILNIARNCQLHVVQLSGIEPPELVNALMENKIETWKAIHISTAKDLEKKALYKPARFLFDTKTAGLYGGSGEAFDWHILQDERDFVLAGGLHPDNVEHAIQSNHPYCIDVSSGVETNGVKDEQKIKNIITATRRNLK